MAVKSDPDLGINSWLEDELYQQYLHDHGAVDESWKHVFENTGGNGSPAAVRPAEDERVPATVPLPAGAPVASGAELVPLRGAAARIAENMEASIAIPMATSQRTIPVKVIDENRRIINHHRTLLGKSKVSYTHIIGWAIVRALEYYPGLNHAYAEQDGQPLRAVRDTINLGIAVDVAAKNGARHLLVPNIKNAGALDFQQYVAAFDDLVSRARTGKLAADDFHHQPRYGRHDAVHPAADARAGRDSRGGHHRLSGGVSGHGARDASGAGHQQSDGADLHL